MISLNFRALHLVCQQPLCHVRDSLPWINRPWSSWATMEVQPPSSSYLHHGTTKKRLQRSELLFDNIWKTYLIPLLIHLIPTKSNISAGARHYKVVGLPHRPQVTQCCMRRGPPQEYLAIATARPCWEIRISRNFFARKKWFSMGHYRWFSMGDFPLMVINGYEWLSQN